jgi:hypothetical protein
MNGNISRWSLRFSLSLALTLGAVSAWSATPSFPIAGSTPKIISTASWNMVRAAPDSFLLGHSKAVQLTVFLDPDCSVCHRFYEELQPLIRAGQVSVRVIPVGVIKPTSLGKAEHIEMPFVDPALKQTATQLLAENEHTFQKGDVGGHITPISNAAAKRVVLEHNAVLERLTALYAGFPSGRVETPVIVFSQGHTHQVIFGAPPKGADALVKAIAHPLEIR